LWAVLMALLSSCDEGMIYPKETGYNKTGMVMRLTANISGYDNWKNTDGYSLVIAGFGEQTGSMDYAVISKNIPEPDEAGNVSLVMSGIPEADVKTLEVCVVNRLRVKLASFSSLDVQGDTRDTLYMESGNIDVSVDRMIHNEVFTPTCASCHGASGKGARGLFLTDDEKFNPVSKASGAVSGKMVVAPGDYQNSVLYNALIDNAGGALHQPHADMLEAKRRDNLLSMVRLWIDNCE